MEKIVLTEDCRSEQIEMMLAQVELGGRENGDNFTLKCERKTSVEALYLHSGDTQTLPVVIVIW